MIVHVLFGKRKDTYPGQQSLEALACMTGNDKNLLYLRRELAKHAKSGEFEKLEIVGLVVDTDKMMNMLRLDHSSDDFTIQSDIDRI